MIQKQGIADIGEGDCVFLYTGHGDLWLNDEWKGLKDEEKAKRRQEFTSGEPGYGISACEYFAQRKVIMIGGDTSANDAQPVGEQEDYAVPCHTELQTRRGIWNLENLEFTPLLKDKGTSSCSCGRRCGSSAGPAPRATPSPCGRRLRRVRSRPNHGRLPSTGACAWAAAG